MVRPRGVMVTVFIGERPEEAGAMLEMMVTGVRIPDTGELPRARGARQPSELRLLIRSEVSRGSMSMLLMSVSPRASNMCPAPESGSAPAVALKQVTLSDKIKFWEGGGVCILETGEGFHINKVTLRRCVALTALGRHGGGGPGVLLVLAVKVGRVAVVVLHHSPPLQSLKGFGIDHGLLDGLWILP